MEKDDLLQVECPSCNCKVSMSWTVAFRMKDTDGKYYVGLVSYGMCDWCCIRGDGRSLKLTHGIEIDEIQQSMADGLPMLDLYKREDDR